MCVLKELLWNTSAKQTKKNTHILCTFAQVMLCFTHFFHITANKMQLQQLHTEKNHLSVEKKRF